MVDRRRANDTTCARAAVSKKAPLGSSIEQPELQGRQKWIRSGAVNELDAARKDCGARRNYEKRVHFDSFGGGEPATLPRVASVARQPTVAVRMRGLLSGRLQSDMAKTVRLGD